jgi:predicted RNA methylase
MILHYVLIVFIVLLFFIICYKIINTAEYSGGLDNKKYKYTFPHRKKFKSVAETHYSVAGPYQTAQEIKIFKSLFEIVPKEIIDATAHVGVDSLTLAYAFPNANITSVERNPVVYELLKENIENLGYSKHQDGRKRFTVVNMSADVYLKDLDHTVDLIYMDPPWGGRGYVAASDLPLHDELGNPTIPLSDVVNIALRKTKLLVLKAPYNFKVDEFGTKINGKIDGIRNINRFNDTSRVSFIFIIIRS